MISRECYQCVSTHSWKDCDDKSYKTRCLTSQPCIKASAHTSVDDAYVKGCAATCSASDLPVCGQPGVKCLVQCCSSDYCNGGIGRVDSAIALYSNLSIPSSGCFLFSAPIAVIIFCFGLFALVFVWLISYLKFVIVTKKRRFRSKMQSTSTYKIQNGNKRDYY